MTTSNTGATYFTITVNIFSALNGLEIFTSSIMAFGLIIQPTNTQAKSAAMGIITELEMKSRKSKMVLPGPSG